MDLKNSLLGAQIANIMSSSFDSLPPLLSLDGVGPHGCSFGGGTQN